MPWNTTNLIQFLDTSLLQILFHLHLRLIADIVRLIFSWSCYLMHTKLSFPQGCLIILLKCEFCLEQVSLGGGTQKPSEKVLFCNHIFGETGRNLNMQTFNTLVV